MCVGQSRFKRRPPRCHSAWQLIDGAHPPRGRSRDWRALGPWEGSTLRRRFFRHGQFGVVIGVDGKPMNGDGVIDHRSDARRRQRPLQGIAVSSTDADRVLVERVQGVFFDDRRRDARHVGQQPAIRRRGPAGRGSTSRRTVASRGERQPESRQVASYSRSSRSSRAVRSRACGVSARWRRRRRHWSSTHRVAEGTQVFCRIERERALRSPAFRERGRGSDRRTPVPRPHSTTRPWL